MQPHNPYVTQAAQRAAPDVPLSAWISARMDIMHGRSVVLERRPDGKQRHLVQLRGEARQVMYDAESMIIVLLMVGGHRCNPPRVKSRRLRWDAE